MEHQEKINIRVKTYCFSHMYWEAKDRKEWLLPFCVQTMGGHLVSIIH